MRLVILNNFLSILIMILYWQEKWFPEYFNQMCQLTSASSEPEAFNVLCHGDPWINNFLFSYNDDKEPNEILFIDFQLCAWGSPAYDLYYVFASSVKPQIKKNEFDHLIRIYHQELVSNLTKLNYSKKIPTLRDLQIDLMRRGFIAGVFAFYNMPIALMKKRDDSKTENLMESNEEAINFKQALFSSEIYLKHLEALFVFLDKRGLLEF